MKRAGLLGCAVLLALALAACDGNGNGTPDGDTPAATIPSTGTPPGGGGMAAQGEAIFTGQTMAAQPFCASCHTVGGGSIVGPDLQGVATRAGQRVAGMSAEEYLRQSILDPDAYVVEGFPPGLMPQTYGQQLSGEQIDALVAYLMTLR